MEGSDEENCAILGEEQSGKAVGLCVSYRLLVWMVLGLGMTFTFSSLSSQAAVFACRRLATHHQLLAHDKAIQLSPHNRTSSDVTLPSSNLTGDWTNNESPVIARHSLLNTENSDSPRNNSRNCNGFWNENTGLEYIGNTTASSIHAFENNSSTRSRTECALYEQWTKHSEDWVMAALATGYYVTQLPAAVISAYIGSFRMCLVATCTCMLTSFLSVPALQWGPVASTIVCFLKGASAGAIYPVMPSLASVWCGERESSVVASVIESGQQVGHAASFLAAACFCNGSSGWANVFYAHVVLGFIFAIMFCLTVRDTPAERTKCIAMSAKEYDFLKTTMKTKGFSNRKPKIPLRCILTSLPVIAIVVAQAGSEWLDCLMVSSFPAFLGIRHGMNEKLVELLTSAGFLLSIPVALASAKVADWLLDNSRVSASTLRKVYDILSKGIPAACFVLLSHLDSSMFTLVAVIYIISFCSTGLTDSAWVANCFDLAPAFAGFILSFAEELTVWVWLLCIVLVSNLAPQNTADQWQTVMYVTAGLMCICVLFYVAFASGQRQKWAVSTFTNNNTEEYEMHQPCLDADDR